MIDESSGMEALEGQDDVNRHVLVMLSVLMNIVIKAGIISLEDIQTLRAMVEQQYDQNKAAVEDEKRQE